MRNNWQFQFTFCRTEDKLLCFINPDRYTDYLLLLLVTDWLQKGYLIRFVVKVVKQLDLTKLRRQCARRRSAVHHPIVLLSLLVYGYVTGIFSSRKKIALDSAKIKGPTSTNTKPFLMGPAQKLESQLKEEVKTLIVRSEVADGESIPDKMDVPIGIAKHEVRLVAIAQVKAKIEARAAERFAVE